MHRLNTHGKKLSCCCKHCFLAQVCIPAQDPQEASAGENGHLLCSKNKWEGFKGLGSVQETWKRKAGECEDEHTDCEYRQMWCRHWEKGSCEEFSPGLSASTPPFCEVANEWWWCQNTMCSPALHVELSSSPSQRGTYILVWSQWMFSALLELGSPLMEWCLRDMAQ